MTDPLDIARRVLDDPLCVIADDEIDALAAEVIRLHALLTPKAPAPDLDPGQLVIPFLTKVPE